MNDAELYEAFEALKEGGETKVKEASGLRRGDVVGAGKAYVVVSDAKARKHDVVADVMFPGGSVITHRWDAGSLPVPVLANVA